MTTYVSILMKHFEQMQIEVAAAAEMTLDADEAATGKDYAFDVHRILFIREGEGTLLTQGKSFSVGEGSLCVLLSGIPHRIVPAPGTELKARWVHFHASYEDRELYRNLNMQPTVQAADYEEIMTLYDRLFARLASPRRTRGLRLKAAMLDLISSVIEQMALDETEDAPTQDLQKLDAVMQYIDDHLADNITVEDLAKQVYLHPNYFIMFFKGLMGISPIQYVNNRRMEEAKNLLLDPDSNVSEVANRVGMQIYYFSRVFKSYTGLTPSRYRKQGSINVPAGENEGEPVT